MRSFDFLEQLIVLLDSLPVNADEVHLPTGSLPIETINEELSNKLHGVTSMLEITVKQGRFYCQIDSNQNLTKLYRLAK